MCIIGDMGSIQIQWGAAACRSRDPVVADGRRARQPSSRPTAVHLVRRRAPTAQAHRPPVSGRQRHHRSL